MKHNTRVDKQPQQFRTEPYRLSPVNYNVPDNDCGESAKVLLLWILSASMILGIIAHQIVS